MVSKLIICVDSRIPPTIYSNNHLPLLPKTNHHITANITILLRFYTNTLIVILTLHQHKNLDYTKPIFKKLILLILLILLTIHTTALVLQIIIFIKDVTKT